MNKPETAKVGAPLMFKKLFFFNIQRTFLFEFHQFYSAKKYLEGYVQDSKITSSPTANSKTGFLTSILSRTIKQLKGGPFEDFKKFSKKSRTAEITFEL